MCTQLIIVVLYMHNCYIEYRKMPELRRRTSPSVSNVNDGGIVCASVLSYVLRICNSHSSTHIVKLQYVLQCLLHRNHRMKATVIVIVIVVVFLVQLKKDNEDQRNNNQMIAIRIRKYHQLIVHREEEGYLQLLFPVASY